MSSSSALPAPVSAPDAVAATAMDIDQDAAGAGEDGEEESQEEEDAVSLVDINALFLSFGLYEVGPNRQEWVPCSKWRRLSGQY